VNTLKPIDVYMSRISHQFLLFFHSFSPR